MITWLVIADTYYGEVNVANMGSDYAFLRGNLMALFVSPMVDIPISLMAPQNYDWAKLRAETDGVSSDSFALPLLSYRDLLLLPVSPHLLFLSCCRCAFPSSLSGSYACDRLLCWTQESMPLA